MTNEKFRFMCKWVFIVASINNLIGYIIGIYHRETTLIYCCMTGQLALGVEIILFNILRSVKK